MPKCDVCGKAYAQANINRRLALDDKGNVVDTDQHEAKCRGWKVLSGYAAHEYRTRRQLRR